VRIQIHIRITTPSRLHQTMNSTDCWAFARLCGMYPVLTGVAAWYLLRGDCLIRTLKAREATGKRRTLLHR
jgi:hypothetical protein